MARTIKKSPFAFTLTDKRKQYLDHLNIYNDLDVINHLPYRYESFNLVKLTKDLDGKVVSFKGVIVNKGKLGYFKGKMSKFTITLANENIEIKCPIFNRPFYFQNVILGKEIIVKGKYNYLKKEISPTDILFNINEEDKIKTIYSLPNGVKDSDYSKLVAQSYNYLKNNYLLENIIPETYKNRYRLIDREKAYYFAHFPSSNEEIKEAYRYLKYEELLSFSLSMQLQKKSNKIGFKVNRNIDYEYINKIIKRLPYKLTKDQLTSLKEILNDLDGNNIMYRLLQGDVGTGKTLVAALSLIAVAKSGYQSVMMAPLDLLARQHYEYLNNLIGDEMNVVLLVSSLSNKEKEKSLKMIKDGTAQIVIGTQALIQDSVVFKNLGYTIIDEQHRFGVNQRKTLKEKGEGVDLLLMSATPIPRTLAISLYGDMDVSILSEFPNKQRNVKTDVLVTNTIKPLIGKIFDLVNNKQRVIIICSMIEGDNEIKRNVFDVYDGLKNYFDGVLNVGLLHGKLSDEEKNAEMMKFKNGKTEVLISTTVIEVGVDVKEASMSIIYDAENFGLAQIHQLRGRVGRAGQESYCYLLTTKNDEDTLKRLNFMKESDDGFEISRFDLSLRGPGELVGQKQSGLPPLQFANFIDDIKILDVAQKDAYYIIQDMENIENRKIINKVLLDLKKDSDIL